MSPEAATKCPLAGALAARLREASAALTRHWLTRIAERVSLDPNRLFPTDQLLDHVPVLIAGIADYVEEPAAEVSVDTPVVAKAMELGALRHDQGFDAYEILKEYEILGGILYSYLADEVDRIAEPCEKSELLVCAQRLFRAISIIQQATTTHFLRLADEQVARRETQLRDFNRAVSHEVKNRIGTLLGSSQVLREMPDMARDERERFLEIIARNAQAMQDAVDNILLLSRTERDARQHRHVRLPEAAREAIRQVREAAQGAGVELGIASGLPDVEVNAAAVELCLTNYLSNAIKYADRSKPLRYVEISGSIEQNERGQREVVLRVRDNGLGVPPEKRGQLFQRFFRAHEHVTDAQGTGLGLSIVRDTVEALGGHAWAEFPGEGAVFAFSLPYRRSEMPTNSGTERATADGR